VTRGCHLWLRSGVVAMLTIACGKSQPEAPAVSPAPVSHVTGAEKLAWTQSAADRAQLSTFRYAVYVDAFRVELAGVSCEPTSPPSTSWECSAPLPPLPNGAHALELAAAIVGQSESWRSAPLRVNKQPPQD